MNYLDPDVYEEWRELAKTRVLWTFDIEAALLGYPTPSDHYIAFRFAVAARRMSNMLQEGFTAGIQAATAAIQETTRLLIEKK